MKTTKVKLREPQISKLYTSSKSNPGAAAATSFGTDPTTTCTTSITTTHFN